MLPVPLHGWGDVLIHVDPEDVFDPDGEHGYTLYPHITVLYGLHFVENPVKLMLYVDSVCKSVDVEFTGISIFENEKFDVLKFDVNAPQLIKLHNKVKSKFKCTVDFENYVPHMTIAFLQKGTGWKYKNLSFSVPKMKIDLMRFTNSDGHETLIKLRNGQ